MKRVALGLVAVVLLLAGSAVPSYAWWSHWGWRGPVVVGPRVVVAPVVVGAPVVYPRPYVYPAPVVVAEPAPVYAQPPQYWYYCASPAGYYPSTPQCPGGWLQVTPQQ